MAKEYKLKIFDLLANLDQKKQRIYEGLSAEEQKELAPLVIMRWMSGGKSKRQLAYLNELVNPFVFSLGKHKELLVNLMSICGAGNAVRHTYPTKKKTNTKLPKTIGIIRTFFGYSSKIAEESLSVLSNEDIISFAEQLGTTKADMAKIKKEIKNRGR